MKTIVVETKFGGKASSGHGNNIHEAFLPPLVIPCNIPTAQNLNADIQIGFERKLVLWAEGMENKDFSNYFFSWNFNWVYISMCHSSAFYAVKRNVKKISG